jgi:tape measure domain-containing protein
MALTDLNVVLRLSTREFNREVKNVERSLQSASDRLSDIGNSLSLALTAPLVGLGGAAIVAAGEFERLRLGLEATMTDAGYSIQQAREELEKLREVAKAPGIDFEQAVQGSLRLQSVGLSAEQARETIAQFANGVAAAGGTAQNLEGVTRQISQIIGKGKVLNEDLIILKENMPSVSKSLVDAFGTADAEGLRKLNISAEELVIRLTEELAKAPRVAGGIANAIQNAQVAVKEAAAKIGDSLNSAFDITGALNKFSDFVVGIADSFSKASPEVQRLIFSLGAFAIALGPGILLGRQLATTYINTTIELAKFARFLNAELARSLAGGATGIRRWIWPPKQR